MFISVVGVWLVYCLVVFVMCGFWCWVGSVGIVGGCCWYWLYLVRGW